MNDTIRDSKVDFLSTKDIDFHGRRITNAGDSKADGDYVTRRELASPGLDFGAVKKWVEELLRRALNGHTITFGVDSKIITIGGAASQLAFFDGTPASKQTLSAYTTDTESVAYTGLTNAAVGTVFASVTNLNSLRVAYENLRLAHDDLRTKLINSTLVG